MFTRVDANIYEEEIVVHILTVKEPVGTDQCCVMEESPFYRWASGEDRPQTSGTPASTEYLLESSLPINS